VEANYQPTGENLFGQNLIKMISEARTLDDIAKASSELKFAINNGLNVSDLAGYESQLIAARYNIEKENGVRE
jgi:hypothetical protein